MISSHAYKYFSFKKNYIKSPPIIFNFIYKIIYYIYMKYIYMNYKIIYI